MTILNKVNNLFVSQLKEWSLAKTNYASLESVEERSINFKACSIRLQFNPERIVSTGAKVDKEDIKNRKCFLCEKNRPKEQKGIVYRNKYCILVNPFPILPVHFTIPTIEHIAQSINDFEDMLLLARDISDYTIIYNAPSCGASAPDHLHFQAGTKNFTQTERELPKIIRVAKVLYSDKNMVVYHTCEYLRTCYILVSTSFDKMIKEFSKIVKNSCLVLTEYNEPCANIICRYDNDRWTTIIFPRKKHRSSHYTDENNKIMISPGTIDMAGVMITPEKKDFNRVCDSDIIEIFKEVTY